MQIYQELKTNNGVLRGFHHRPEGNADVPLVVMYHGFTGHKAESKFLFSQLSRYLCNHNIASLRFDFLGSGDSDQEFSYMTFSNEVTEGLMILDYALTLPNVSKIIILGLSMGGAVATQVAKQRPSDIARLVLLAPAGNMNKIVNNEQYKVPTLDNGNYELGGLEISQAFVDDIVKQDLFSDVDKYLGPVSLHHGENDQAVPIIVSQKYHQIYKNSQIHIYPNSDHTFSNVLVRRQLFMDILSFLKE